MLQEYKNDGYCLVKNVFNKYEVELLYRDIREVFEIQGKKEGIVSENDQLVYDLAERNWGVYLKCALAAHQVPRLHTMGAGETLLHWVRCFGLKVPSINMKPVLFVSSPRLATNKFYWKAEAHQDYSGMRGSLNGMVAWMPLVPMTKDMGYLEVAPASHRLGFVNHELAGPGFVTTENHDVHWHSVEMDVGDVLFFSAFTLHRSGNNTSDKIRWAVNWRFDDLTEPTYIERGFVKPFSYERTKEPLPEGFPSVEQIQGVFS